MTALALSAHRMASSRMAPLRATVMGDVVGRGDEAVLHPPETLGSHRPRGWQPKGGEASRQAQASAAEEVARSGHFFSQQKGERDAARRHARQPGQRRGSTQAAFKTELQRQRKGRVKTKGSATP